MCVTARKAHVASCFASIYTSWNAYQRWERQKHLLGHIVHPFFFFFPFHFVPDQFTFRSGASVSFKVSDQWRIATPSTLLGPSRACGGGFSCLFVLNLLVLHCIFSSFLGCLLPGSSSPSRTEPRDRVLGPPQHPVTATENEPRGGRQSWDPRYVMRESKCFFSARIIFTLTLTDPSRLGSVYFQVLHKTPVTELRGKGGQSTSKISSLYRIYCGLVSSAPLSQTISDPAVTDRLDDAGEKHGEHRKIRGLLCPSCV